MARSKWTWLLLFSVFALLPGCSGGGGTGGGASTAVISGIVTYNSLPALAKTVKLYEEHLGLIAETTTNATDPGHPQGYFSFADVATSGKYIISCNVASGVTVTYPEAGTPYQAIILGNNDFSITYADLPPAPPTL